MKTDSADDTDPIIRRLKTLAQDSPYLKGAARLYKAILPLLRDANLHVETISITPEQAHSKMELGLPLLHDLALELDGQAVCELMLRLVHAVETVCENNDELFRAEAARRIRLALEKDKLKVNDLLPYIASGKSEVLKSAAQSLQLDPDLVWALAQNALKPALYACCRQLTPLAEGISWHKGYCFICGTGAIVGELQENTQVKHLRCGQCGADWLFRRLQCIYCGNEDHNTLGLLYMEGKREKMRVELCNSCNGYLKVIATFSPTPPEMLPVEDLATLHLDYIAQERSYVRRACGFVTPDDTSGNE